MMEKPVAGSFLLVCLTADACSDMACPTIFTSHLSGLLHTDDDLCMEGNDINQPCHIGEYCIHSELVSDH